MKGLQRRIGMCWIAVLAAAILAGQAGSLRAQDRRAPELRPVNSDPISFRMIGQTPATLYETIARLAGIQVLWAPEAKAQSETGRFTVEASKATLREALDKVASVTNTSWKPASGTTISVALR
jgi:general secretion pathway protein D